LLVYLVVAINTIEEKNCQKDIFTSVFGVYLKEEKSAIILIFNLSSSSFYNYLIPKLSNNVPRYWNYAVPRNY